ncbi:MAG: hypothetical protein HAW60_05550 [Bdellovibrionales bacterium]|nr:hypothetical protein [Bdellovibrionales bacterium]
MKSLIVLTLMSVFTMPMFAHAKKITTCGPFMSIIFPFWGCSSKNIGRSNFSFNGFGGGGEHITNYNDTDEYYQADDMSLKTEKKTNKKSNYSNYFYYKQEPNSIYSTLHSFPIKEELNSIPTEEKKIYGYTNEELNNMSKTELFHLISVQSPFNSVEDNVEFVALTISKTISPLAYLSTRYPYRNDEHKESMKVAKAALEGVIDIEDYLEFRADRIPHKAAFIYSTK